MNPDGFLTALGDLPDTVDGTPVEASLWNREVSQAIDMIIPSCSLPADVFWFTEELQMMKQRG